MRLFKTANKFVLILTALLAFSCKEKYLETVVTDKRIDISSEWQEVVPVRPLRCERRNQEIQLYPSTPHSASVHPLGIVLANGKVAKPEVQLVGEDGKIYELPDLSLLGDAVVLSSKALPRSFNFRKVRIRSNEPLQLSEVRFSCYNFEDVKR
jgi:hypothetical protein